MQVMQLMQVILFAKDIARMAAFYSEGLGLPVVEGSPGAGWMCLDAGTCALALHAIPEPIAAHILVEDPPQPRSDSSMKLAFHVDDIEMARTSLVRRGAVMYDVRRTEGAALCDGLDPEGNVFQISTGVR